MRFAFPSRLDGPAAIPQQPTLAPGQSFVDLLVRTEGEMMSGILHADETLCTAADERLAIAVWHGEPTLHHMNLLEDMVRERVRLYASNILLVIVERPVLPAEASRARMTEVMELGPPGSRSSDFLHRWICTMGREPTTRSSRSRSR